MRDLNRSEATISYMLRYGVLISAFFLAGGLLLHVFHPQVAETDFDLKATSHAAPPYVPNEVLQGLLHGQADAWLAAGLLVLIGLPILRVGLTVFLFLAEKDRVYFFITLIVFLILLSGIYFGKAI